MGDKVMKWYQCMNRIHWKSCAVLTCFLINRNVPHNRAIDNGGTEISFFFKNMYAEGGQILKSVMLKKIKKL